MPALSDRMIACLQTCIEKVIRAKGKQREQMTSMKGKYIFAKHSLPHYFDPVTGILRRKEQFNDYRQIDELREKQLIQEIMRQKVARLDFEDARSDELKEFMNVWNQVTVEVPSDQIASDRARVKEYLRIFLDKYCDYQSNYIKADFVNRKQIFLAHLLNLYNASLINSRDLLE